MNFLVKMRDGASFTVDASYIEVVRAPASSYTFLGPVPGYPVAIIATFPVELVAAVLPLEQAKRNDGSASAPRATADGPADPGPARANDGPPVPKRPTRPPLPPIAAADV